MYKQFKVKKRHSMYLPEELLDAIQDRANDGLTNFNRVLFEVLLKEFLPHRVPQNNQSQRDKDALRQKSVNSGE